MSKVIIFPTDTVYGIGASVFDTSGMERIYQIKHRPHDKPLAVLCANLEQIEDICILNDTARKLINKFMPGALTIIVPSKDNIKKSMGLEMVGVRIPASHFAISILEENGPMATTSVNESGEVPLNEYDEIVIKYNDLVDEIYPSIEASSNISSTVVMIKNGEIKLLREGTIKYAEILKEA